MKNLFSLTKKFPHASELTAIGARLIRASVLIAMLCGPTQLLIAQAQEVVKSSEQTNPQVNPPAGSPSPIRKAGEYLVGPKNKAESLHVASTEDDSMLASLFSGTGGLVMLGLAIFALLVVGRVRSRSALPRSNTHETNPSQSHPEGFSGGENNDELGWKVGNNGLVKDNRATAANGSSRERKAVARTPVTMPASLYGAYRIDQEVGKLVLGHAHRMDVLSSRATDDRRAIENSLIKVVTSPHSSDNERRRAREALEEYGFVARQCASLLLAPDAFERTSAARSLGEIGSPAGLSFLLEGLYDFESIVRNQAVVSIGELKIPSAIGALLDTARKHPDIPISLITRALSACSVEGLNSLAATVSYTGLLKASFNARCGLDITHLEPATSIEELPETSDHEGLSAALSQLASLDQEERGRAVKCLAEYRVQSSVAALASVARHDSEPTVRALAISSLASMNHESVFSAVLLGLADESREVRASAARSLSRLSFDRSEAYVRVIETSGAETLREIAEACIEAGIVSQNIDRLASSDHRQAYEAFSLICLLTRAKLTQPVLEAISGHADMNVRLTAIHLLATTGQPEIGEQLSELATNEGIPETVKTAIREAIYKLEQTKESCQEPIEELIAHGLGCELADEKPDVQDDETNTGFELEKQVDNVEF